MPLDLNIMDRCDIIQSDDFVRGGGKHREENIYRTSKAGVSILGGGIGFITTLVCFPIKASAPSVLTGSLVRRLL
jgi:hypothetical protein